MHLNRSYGRARRRALVVRGVVLNLVAGALLVLAWLRYFRDQRFWMPLALLGAVCGVVAALQFLRAIEDSEREAELQAFLSKRFKGELKD